MKNDEILKRLEEIQNLKEKLNKIEKTPPVFLDTNESSNKFKYKKGISVIIPTYKGEEVILRCLSSLKNQTLSMNLFEIIIVINGEKDSTELIVKDYVNELKLNNVSIFYSHKANASEARNIGISNANNEYLIFIDDDDYISENLLEEMHRYANKDSIVVSQIVNVNEDGITDNKNPINNQIIRAGDNENNDYRSLNMVLSINACKLVPTEFLKNNKIKYDTRLRSGEDVVFFANILVKSDFKYIIIPIKEQAIYYRVLRENSLSRQKMTYDFYVIQRLMVIKCLNEILNKTVDINKQNFIKQKINAQSLFINKYIKENTNQREKITNEIKKQGLTYLPYPIINKGLASKLIISYCFPPYMDTAGNVMGKRLRSMNEIVDVVYNKMDKVRNKDYFLNLLVDDLIEDRIEIPSYPSFSNWKAIQNFCSLGMSKINKNKNYKEVYSRAMWPGSHFLAYEYKKNNPNVKWVAEFSDPILFDINSKVREANIDDTSFIQNVNRDIKKKYNLPAVEDKNLFFWCEYLPYLFADKLVFTNENQQKYMMDCFPIKKVRTIIEEKAVVSQQPTLPKEYYYKKISNYHLENDKVHIAYFGSFYQTRNLDDLFGGLKNLDSKLKRDIRLHIFTSDPKVLEEKLKKENLKEFIKINPYVSYQEFLNLTTIFDCLVVNDAHTKECKPLNPYLPSKLSDYAGSGRNIWGLYENSSVLSKYPLAYKSELGNIQEAANVFKQILKDTSKSAPSLKKMD